MSKLSLISQCLSDKFGLTKQEADNFVTELFAIVRERLETDKVVKVRGLGTFKLSETNPRESVSVNSGERITIEGRYKLTFTPENAVRDRINSPFVQFEPVDLDEDFDFSAIDEKYAGAGEAEDAAGSPVETVTDSREPELEEPVGPVVTPDVAEAASAEAAPPSEEKPVVEDKLVAEAKPTTGEASPAEEKPVAEETPVSKADSASTEPPIVRSPSCEELIREGISGNRRIIRLLHGLLILVGICVLAVVVYFCYLLWNDMQGRKASPEPASMTSQSQQPTASADTTLATRREEAATDSASAAPAAGQSPTESLDSIYNMDRRVRTGAYVIVGLDTTVTVIQGQTFRGICRAYLGDGMECYVEVFNGGMKTASPGDRIKIPKVKLKKRKR